MYRKTYLSCLTIVLLLTLLAPAVAQTIADVDCNSESYEYWKYWTLDYSEKEMYVEADVTKECGLALNPVSLELMDASTRNLYAQGLFAEAIEEYQTYDIAEGLTYEDIDCKLAFEEGLYLRAVEVCTIAYTQTPGTTRSAGWLYYRALANYHVGNYEQSILDFMLHSMKSTISWGGISRAYFAMGNLGKALEAIDMGLMIDPGDPSLVNLKIEYYESVEDYRSALAVLTEHSFTDCSVSADAVNYFLREYSRIAAHTDSWPVAVNLLNSSLCARNSIYFAQGFVIRGEFEDAKVWLDQASPKTSDEAYVMASLYEQMGYDDLAQNMYSLSQEMADAALAERIGNINPPFPISEDD